MGCGSTTTSADQRSGSMAAKRGCQVHERTDGIAISITGRRARQLCASLAAQDYKGLRLRVARGSKRYAGKRICVLSNGAAKVTVVGIGRRYVAESGRKLCGRYIESGYRKV